VAVKVCRLCGCRLASDRAEDDELCSPCIRSRRNYDPRKDPLFLDKLLDCLLGEFGKRVEPLKALGLAPEYRGTVKDGIRTLRRLGFIITATERCSGYHYLGYVETTYKEISLTQEWQAR
jgi:hypothetical protein